MIGAHIDSWHTGVGATDNADGSTTVIEAMRILKAIGARPRRTIRVALWGGEEQGLLGSKAWVAAASRGRRQRAPRARSSTSTSTSTTDTGRSTASTAEHNEARRPLFDGWLEPFKDLGARRNVDRAASARPTTSASSRPGCRASTRFRATSNYDIRTHHTNMDTPERLDEKDISQAAIVMASFAYQAATIDQKVPRAAGR